MSTLTGQAASVPDVTSHHTAPRRFILSFAQSTHESLGIELPHPRLDLSVCFLRFFPFSLFFPAFPLLSLPLSLLPPRWFWIRPTTSLEIDRGTFFVGPIHEISSKDGSVELVELATEGQNRPLFQQPFRSCRHCNPEVQFLSTFLRCFYETSSSEKAAPSLAKFSLARLT
jgi:hypothetical protein